MVTTEHGFSLVELMIAIAIMSILMVMGAPLTRAWVANAHIAHAQNVLAEGYATLRALSLKNPLGVKGDQEVASLTINGKLLSAGYRDAYGTVNMVWQGNIDTDVTLALTEAGCANTLRLNNLGMALDSRCLAYKISSAGGRDESSTLQ
ncbi:pilus assembly FimT family protein [Gynuella sunshinyii]|uniref:Tfp pilus assembly protein FimT n=1 Tax=Gynuella sunshinyii YC6258 TaxID=1445510 RepID=A0A0C5VV28_9GAMM|nr:prepilin-type N-terminal cleavage/methylation domain-containing protein [Gynuella sunshinyii]AJQ97158.1 tfp pilus assembly protein FimT [Gynuella sunshinyii YC6258]